jgi:DNA-binding XRE family transcriptional regulator
MQAVVKTHHIRIDAEWIPEELIAFLKEHYGEVQIISDPEEELIEVKESAWYKAIKNNIHPGDNVKIYRELHGWSQTELGRRLGGIPRQNISSIEHNRRAISKEIARKLSRLFNVSIEKFI